MTKVESRETVSGARVIPWQNLHASITLVGLRADSKA